MSLRRAKRSGPRLSDILALTRREEGEGEADGQRLADELRRRLLGEPHRDAVPAAGGADHVAVVVQNDVDPRAVREVEYSVEPLHERRVEAVLVARLRPGPHHPQPDRVPAHITQVVDVGLVEGGARGAVAIGLAGRVHHVVADALPRDRGHVRRALDYDVRP